jgi:hypothetical protein
MAQITLNSTGVASDGALVLQSNGTTTAVTISTAQVATLEKDAVVNGLTVGRGAGAVSTNTAVGASALAANQAGGTNNTAIGNAALDANTTGDANTAVGDSALGANTTASNNTAVGYQALDANTTGTTNVAIGVNALGANTTANDNVAVGVGAMEDNTTGAQNTVVGRDALANNTTASNNTAVGYQAAYSQQTGIDTTAVGYRALYTATGLRNTAIGKEALYSLTTGTNNTAIGESAGYSMTTGSKNTILGSYSGNQGSLDIRTANGNIVISDGDGNPKLYYQASNTRWILQDQFWPTGMRSGAGTNAAKYNTGTGELTYDTSSARYKDNIRDSVYGLSHVMQMRSTQFEYKDDGRSDVGLIAEELQPIIPELVGINKEGQADSVSYDRMVSVLVKAIQELKADLDATKAELAALKGTA